jgi:hypothetical protein
LYKTFQVVWALITCGQLDGCEGNNNAVLEYISLSAPKKDKGFSTLNVNSFRKVDPLKQAREFM